MAVRFAPRKNLIDRAPMTCVAPAPALRERSVSFTRVNEQCHWDCGDVLGAKS